MPQADAGFRRIPPGGCPPGVTIVHITCSQWRNRQGLRREEMATAAERRCRADARNGPIQPLQSPGAAWLRAEAGELGDQTRQRSTWHGPY
jgi:hypothetical protein